MRFIFVLPLRFVLSLSLFFVLQYPPGVRADVLVELDATQLPEGDLEVWRNTGSLVGDFEAEVAAGVVETIDGARGVTFDGSATWYVGPAAPESVTGANSRTVEAWVYNPEIAGEETVFAWGRRGGSEGTNTSFNHGSNADFGAVGHWGSPDIGWNGTQEAGAWSHIAYTWDAGTRTTNVYKNGAAVNSEEGISLNTWAVDNLGDPLPFVVGNQNEGNGSRTPALSASMTIAVVRVHDTALDPEGIKRGFNRYASTFGMERDDGVLVELDASGLPEGALDSWRNFGSVGGAFEAEVDSANVTIVDGTKGLTLGGDNDWYVGPAAPASVTGASSRTVEAWVYNPEAAGEETVIAWGRRGGPEGSNTSFNHGSNASFGAVGHWGAPDIGWNGTLVTGEWSAIAYTWDADTGTTTVYTNGVAANTEEGIALNTWAEDSNGEPLPFVLGNQNEADGTRTNALVGSMTIGLVRVTEGALDGDAILANYQTDLPSFGLRDSDGDGIPDAIEDSYAFLDSGDPSDAAKDQDGDGLSNLGEVEAGTDLEAADSDGDSFSDGEEVEAGSDPLDPDSKPSDFDRGKLVDLDATSLPAGPLERWSNTGSVGGEFVAELGVPSVQTIDEVKAVVLNGVDDWYVGPIAPPSVTGTEGSRTVEAWVHNPQIASEETVFAWGARGGPEGSNTSFNHGSNDAFGAVGHWGAPDIGWAGTQLAGEWTYIVYTWDAETSETNVYTNGALANTEGGIFLSTHAEDSAGDPLPFVVGNQNEGGGGRTAPLAGSMAIARIRVHGTALPAATIKATFDAEVGAFRADKDSDGLPNAYEALFAFLDPDNPDDAAADFDGDGLSALAEFQAGTSPELPDTDGDGFSDGAELSRQPPTDPLLADSDQDGLQDGEETASDPLNIDSDGDGYIDGREVAHGSNPANAESVPDFSTPVAVISLNASALPEGELAVWPNTGVIAGDFVAETEVPGTVVEIDGRKGVELDGTNWYVGPSAPVYLTSNEAGDTPSRSVAAWVNNPDLAGEETVFAWGRRNGPNGTNTSFNHGSNADFGAVGHWGAPDIGWAGTEVAGEWTHIVYTWDGTTETTNVYTDGELANSEEFIALDTWSVDSTGLPLPFMIGNQNEPDGSRTPALTASMTIAEIRVYDQALTPEQVVLDRDGLLGTGPRGRFEIVSVSVAAGAAADTVDVTIVWQSAPGESYRVAMDDDLQGGWTELADGVDAEGDTTAFTHSAVPASTRRLFYQVTRE